MNGVETPIQKYTGALPSDGLGLAAYDGNRTTKVSAPKGIVKIDPSMHGRKLDFVSTFNCNGCTTQTIDVVFTLADDSTVTKTFNTYPGSVTVNTTSLVVIPEGAKELKVNKDNGGYHINEITIYTTPEISNTKYYYTIYGTGIVNGYNDVAIQYFPTSQQRFIKLIMVIGCLIQMNQSN